MALTNGITIEVHTCSFRSVRGYTVIGAVLDEVAFYRSDDSANPDHELVNALRPAMATVPSAMLLGISSPYARRGVLWDMHRRYYGRAGDVFVWQAPTRAMNPTVPAHVIETALAEDEPAARAEYLAEFRRDIETFIGREVLDAVIVPGQHELSPVLGVAYFAFVDPSGGSGDSFTLAIAHQEHDDDERRIGVLDAVREVRPPFSPEAVVQEFAALLRQYRVTSVLGDRYAGVWPRERFREHGVGYIVASKTKAEFYGLLLPLLNSRRVELLDHPRMVAQLCGLERRVAWGGRENIDHAPGGRDDVANAVAGALVWATWRDQRRSSYARPTGYKRPTGLRRITVPRPHVPRPA